MKIEKYNNLVKRIFLNNFKLFNLVDLFKACLSTEKKRLH